MTGISDTDSMTRPSAIDPDLLRSFLGIAETGSFTRAAQMVGRSQSAVSMQLQRLETLLGHSLLSRGKGGAVRLTPEGSRLLERAKEMLSINDAIWAEFRGLDTSHQVPPDDYALPLKAQREAFTAQVMLTLLTNEKFGDAYALVMRCVEKGIVVDAVTLDSKDDTLYMALLSMLEYISINFLSNTLDRDIVLRQRRSGLLRVYETLAGYIAHKRQVWNRPNAYRSFEIFIKQHVMKNDGGAGAGSDPADALVAPYHQPLPW
ncbi:LysR family transcriptional regulator [Acidisphaera sp. S103]|uniref:LysR family transcriptional regulator n=1 Tax=Acidisphaera sp. S103 TaxID=1747223 RepID=UPI0020B171E4|nr:LysR family transcriptional regulator [Acidisphaera sp. S103]